MRTRTESKFNKLRRDAFEYPDGNSELELLKLIHDIRVTIRKALGTGRDWQGKGLMWQESNRPRHIVLGALRREFGDYVSKPDKPDRKGGWACKWHTKEGVPITMYTDADETLIRVTTPAINIK